MHQDDNGYLWFGTYDGLNLYNSKNILVYRFDLQIEESLCSNIIHKITPAGNNELWISTFLGLNKFSLTDRKVTESYPECPEAKLLGCDKQGNTCLILKDNYIQYYRSESKKFHKIPLNGLKKSDVKALYAINKNTFNLLTKDGRLMRLTFSPKNGKTDLQKETDFKHKYEVTFASYDYQFLYWIDENGWLFMKNLSSEQTIFIKDMKEIISRYGIVSEITTFKNDIYLAFKSNGVLKLVRNKGYRAEEVNMKIGIFSLLKDRYQDILWIGTDGQGVEMYYNKPDQFQSLTLDQLPFNLQKPVRAIYTEKDQLWIGTKGGGIVCIENYDQISSENVAPTKAKSFTSKDGLPNNQVFAIQKSHYSDILWIGTEGPGISYYSFTNNKIKTPNGSNSNEIEKVHSICETNDSTLWLATAGAGIQKVIFQSTNGVIRIKSVEKFTFENNGRICNEFHSLTNIKKSTLLIGSRGGYGLIKFNTESYEYSFIPMNSKEYSAIGDVLSVHQSKDSIFYIGASSGLTKLQFLPHNKTKFIQQFDRRDGLANDMIHGILEDKDNCIWLSTNKGLAKYNPQNNYFHTYTQGIEVTEFSDDAFWQEPGSNRLFFGGTNGLVWFEPGADKKPVFQTNFSFFDLKFSGKSVPWSDYFNSQPQQIEIPPKVRSFTISFVAADNFHSNNYEYSYQLKGYSSSWVKLQKNNAATFSNLPAGDYILNIKFNNDVFNAEENVHSIKIRVLPSWYFTSTMIFIYMILGLLIMLFIIWKVRMKIKKKQKAFARKMEEEQREKLLETKLNFFTNITHELCTPLTLINGVSGQITAEIEENPTLKKYTNVLNNNVASLNQLIQEVLDFRKIEDSEFALCTTEKVSISKLAMELKESFRSLSTQNNVKFDIQVAPELNWNTDSAYLKKILTNLTSNAFKYCKKEGWIEIKIRIENNHLKLSVFNTGPGIAPDEIPHIFNRFRISNDLSQKTNIQNAARNGLGLSICRSLVNILRGTIEVKSEYGENAEFIVTLPEANCHEKKPATNNTKRSDQSSASSSEIKSSKPGILVVDDNQDITWLINQTLSSQYHIQEASNGLEALKLIDTETPELIITDIIMPGMTGLELTKQIKAGKYTKNIPIIIISAKITNTEQAEGYETGADAYLTKPFSSELLTSVANRLIQNKHGLKNYYKSSESVYEFSEGKLVHSEDKELLKNVIDIIKDNIENEELRPGFIADELGMNVRSFYRQFKNMSSLSPSEFIKDYRLNYAVQMLLITKLTVQEIIYKTGITNKSYFYREFAKKFNMTPKEYRNQEQNN